MSSCSAQQMGAAFSSLTHEICFLLIQLTQLSQFSNLQGLNPFWESRWVA